MVMERTCSVADIETEAWLSGHGVTWTFEEALPLASIDTAASLANQARLEPVVEEGVDRYADDMERGERFPAVVVNRKGGRSKSLVLIGGNHRTAAAGRAKRETLPAYVIEVAPAMARRLAYEDNRRHGLAPSEDERILQALHLVNGGASQGEAARIVGLSVGKVQRGLAVARADVRAKAMGIEGWAKLPRSTRWRLSSLDADVVFETAARLVVASGMGATDTYDLVSRIGAAGSVEDALGIVGDEEETRSELGRRGGGPMLRTSSPRAKMLDALRVICALNPASVVASCVTDDHRDLLGERIIAAARNLQATHQKLTT